MIKLSYVNYLKLFTLLLVFNILFFGYFGIVQGVKGINQKITHLRKHKEIYAILQNEDENIATLKNLIAESHTYKAALDKSIPYSAEVDDYLVDFLVTAARHGYAVEKFSVSKQSDQNALGIETIISGNLTELHDFIQDVESLDRLTTVNKVDANFEEGMRANINLTIYQTARNL